MKKIIVYIFTSGKHPTMERITREVADAFEAIGHEVTRIFIEKQEDRQLAYDLMRSGAIDFSVGLNSCVSGIFTAPGETMYKNLDTPYVSILLDAPYHRAVDNIGFDCKNHVLCLLDREHISVASKLYPKKKFLGEIFLPLAGIASGNEEEVFSRERPYDVIVSAGSFSDGNPVRYWHDMGIDSSVIKILDDVADYLLAYPVSLEQGFKQVLEDRGLYGYQFSDIMIRFYYMMLRYVKAVRRAMSIELLIKNDIKVDIFGAGWENIPIVNTSNNVTLHNGTSYQEALDLMGDAKIVYQDQALFNNGAHDRVFSAMLNGAVVVSEYSAYLDEEFENGRDIFLYDWKNGFNQVNVISELVNDESKRLSAAVSAYGKVNQKHRWANRAASIVEAVELLKLREGI